MSLPLGDRNFFTLTEDAPADDRTFTPPPTRPVATGDAQSSPASQRRRQLSATNRIVRRKQVSLDMFAPSNEFFAGIEELVEEEVEPVVTEEGEVKEPLKELFFPLRFPPRLVAKKKGHGEEQEKEGEGGGKDIEAVGTAGGKPEEIVYKIPPDDYVVKATRKDKIRAIILFCLMTIFLAVCVGWKTHEDEGHKLFGTVGTACVTPCHGGTEYRNFFKGHHDHFHEGEVSLKLSSNQL